MPEKTNAQAGWTAALDRFHKADQAYSAWKKQNPYPGVDRLPRDADAAMRQIGEWEQGSDAVAGPYSDSVQALNAFPAPDLAAVIVKLGFIRRAIDAPAVEMDLQPFLQAIECDLRRLSARYTSNDENS